MHGAETKDAHCFSAPKRWNRIGPEARYDRQRDEWSGASRRCRLLAGPRTRFEGHGDLPFLRKIPATALRNWRLLPSFGSPAISMDFEIRDFAYPDRSGVALYREEIFLSQTYRQTNLAFDTTTP